MSEEQQGETKPKLEDAAGPISIKVKDQDGGEVRGWAVRTCPCPAGRKGARAGPVRRQNSAHFRCRVGVLQGAAAGPAAGQRAQATTTARHHPSPRAPRPLTRWCSR